MAVFRLKVAFCSFRRDNGNKEGLAWQEEEKNMM